MSSENWVAQAWVMGEGTYMGYFCIRSKADNWRDKGAHDSTTNFRAWELRPEIEDGRRGSGNYCCRTMQIIGLIIEFWRA